MHSLAMLLSNRGTLLSHSSMGASAAKELPVADMAFLHHRVLAGVDPTALLAPVIPTTVASVVLAEAISGHLPPMALDVPVDGLTTADEWLNAVRRLAPFCKRLVLGSNTEALAAAEGMFRAMPFPVLDVLVFTGDGLGNYGGFVESIPASVTQLFMSDLGGEQIDQLNSDMRLETLSTGRGLEEAAPDWRRPVVAGIKHLCAKFSGEPLLKKVLAMRAHDVAEGKGCPLETLIVMNCSAVTQSFSTFPSQELPHLQTVRYGCVSDLIISDMIEEARPDGKMPHLTSINCHGHMTSTSIVSGGKKVTPQLRHLVVDSSGSENTYAVEEFLGRGCRLQTLCFPKDTITDAATVLEPGREHLPEIESFTCHLPSSTTVLPVPPTLRSLHLKASSPDLALRFYGPGGIEVEEGVASPSLLDTLILRSPLAAPAAAKIFNAVRPALRRLVVHGETAAHPAFVAEPWPLVTELTITEEAGATAAPALVESFAAAFPNVQHVHFEGHDVGPLVSAASQCRSLVLCTSRSPLDGDCRFTKPNEHNFQRGGLATPGSSDALVGSGVTRMWVD